VWLNAGGVRDLHTHEIAPFLVTQSLINAIQQIIANYMKDFNVTEMANFSQKRNLCLGYEITLTYGTINKIEVCLEQGIPFESKYGEDERLNCPGTRPMLLYTLTPS